MTTQNTPHLGLPLPHPDNPLEEDIVRIRTAFTGLDRKIQAIDTMLSSDDINLDTLQELVSAIKAAQSDLGLVDQLIADQLETFGATVAQQLDTLQGSVNQQLMNQSAQVNAQMQSVGTQIASMQASVDDMGALVYAGLL